MNGQNAYERVHLELVRLARREIMGAYTSRVVRVETNEWWAVATDIGTGATTGADSMEAERRSNWRLATALSRRMKCA